MSKASRKRQRQRARPDGETAATAEVGRDIPFAILAALGMVLTAILIWGAAGDSGLPYCSDGSGCDLVQGSAWSRFLGVPLAVWGFALYALMLVVALGVRHASRRRFWLGLAATSGLAVSLYLTAVSVFVIDALCAYCLASLALLAVMFAYTLVRRLPSAGWRAQTLGTAGAIVLAGMMHADAMGAFNAAGVVDPELRRLAEHLAERGDIFYGASWCPHCQQQKDLFGAAAEFLPYVECSPHGPRGPRSTTCQMADIRNYPTWVIDGRKVERLMSPELLGKITGFAKTPPEP